MRSPFLEYFASALPERGLTVVRFNFPYMERTGTRPPDKMDVLADCYQSVVEAEARRTGCPPGPLFVGGKSMGARVAAHMVGRGVVAPTGLVFLGFALHSEADRETLRTDDLPLVHQPMLFIQGSRDPLCDLKLLTRVRREMNLPGAVHIVDGGDHSFQLAAAQKAQQQKVMERVADVVAIFVKRVLEARAAAERSSPGD